MDVLQAALLCLPSSPNTLKIYLNNRKLSEIEAFVIEITLKNEGYGFFLGSI